LKKETKPCVKKEADIVDLTQERKKKVKLENRLAFAPGEIIDLT
jgi:hypothetical protein